MKRPATCGLVALLLALLTGGFAPTATADSPVAFSLRVNHSSLRSGQTLQVTTHGNVTCTWVVEWNGVRHVGHGPTFTTSFTAPEVAGSTKIVLRAKCFYYRSAPRPSPQPTTAATPGPVDAQTILVTVPPSWSAAKTITVSPRAAVVSPPDPDNPHHGALPGTGGPRLWPLLVGLLTSLVGAMLVGIALRRSPGAAVAQT